MKNKTIYSVFAVFFFIFIIATLCVLNIQGLNEFEINIIKNVQQTLSSIPNNIPALITDLPYGSRRNLVITILVIAFLISQKFKQAIISILALPIAKEIYCLFKALIERDRPPLELRMVDVHSSSFPSGHSTMSMVLYGLCIYYAWKYIKNKALRNIVVGLLSIVILMIGFTRVWLGVHYPTDIIGGFSLGICIICIYASICNYEFKFIKNKEKEEKTNQQA